MLVVILLLLLMLLVISAEVMICTECNNKIIKVVWSIISAFLFAGLSYIAYIIILFISVFGI